ncbi:hypothetical protein RYH80_09565 [Halobaculum sp. MBLA0147]|uniref:hypothetical protein n=1 Tax=Halobaculum sp. MBLA0147 TaxID=3079934 RepID=UPI003524E487
MTTAHDDGASLRARLVGAGPETVCAFLAACYRERDWTVERGVASDTTGDEWHRLAVTSPRGRTRRLFVPSSPVAARSRSDDEGEDPVAISTPSSLGADDRVVWTADGLPPFGDVSTATVLGTDALCEQFRYALDPSQRDRVAATVFGVDDAAAVLTRPERTVPSPPSSESVPSPPSSESAPSPSSSESVPSPSSSESVPSPSSSESVPSPPSSESVPSSSSSERSAESATDADTDGSRAPGADREEDSRPPRSADTDPPSAGGHGDTVTAERADPPANSESPAAGDRSRLWLVTLAAVCLAVALGGLATGLGPAAPWADPGSPAEGVAVADGTPTAGTTTFEGRVGTPRRSGGVAGATGADTGTPVADAEALPPGVGADGSLDVALLADRTRAVLSTRSYRFVYTYRERVAGRATVRWRETATVAGPGQYASRVSTLGTPVDEPTTFDRTPVYVADGTAVELLRDGSVSRARTDGVGGRRGAASDPFLSRLEQYVDWYLTVEATRLRGRERTANGTVALVALRGDPWPGVENTTGTVVVGPDGLVREIHRSYTLPNDPAVTATVTVRVTAVGETTVDPPAWVQRNGTATATPGTETATAGNGTTSG